MEWKSGRLWDHLRASLVMKHSWPSPVSALAAAKSVLVGRSLSPRHWPVFTELVRNAIFKWPWVDWYLSLFTYSRGHTYNRSLEPASTTNKAIHQGARELFLGCGLWHLGMKYHLQINKHPPFPSMGSLFRKPVMSPVWEISKNLPPPPLKKAGIFFMSVAEMGLAFDHCSGVGKGKAVPEWVIHKNFVLGFGEGQALLYLQIRTVFLSMVFCWLDVW